MTAISDPVWAALQVWRQHEEDGTEHRRSGWCAQCTRDTRGGCRMREWARTELVAAGRLPAADDTPESD